MAVLADQLNDAIAELLGRASGPLHMRLVLQPIVSALTAIVAGLRDAKNGQPAFLWTVVSQPRERRRLILCAWRDVARIFIIGLVLDTIYQVSVLQAFHVLQAVIVAVALAVVPYVVLRGPSTRIARLWISWH